MQKVELLKTVDGVENNTEIPWKIKNRTFCVYKPKKTWNQRDIYRHIRIAKK